MMSRREQIVRTVLARCALATAPTPVLRQPLVPLARESAPALVLSVSSDALQRKVNDRQERELVLRLLAYARDPLDGYAQADELLCLAHLALFAEPTLGGLALGLDEMEVDYQSEDADVDALAIPASYRITYRTLVSDITQGG